MKPQSNSFNSRAANKPSSRRTVRGFTIGSPRALVIRLQGQPDRVDRYERLGYEVWRYGSDTVEFSIRTGRVTKWINFAKGLNVGLSIGPDATSDETFTVGSHIDDVLRLQGVPDAIEWLDSPSLQAWHFGKAFVEIAGGRVQAWRNSRHILKVSMTPGAQTTRRYTVSVGSTLDDVIRIMGTPDRIDRYERLDSELWHYANAIVALSISDRRVREVTSGKRHRSLRIKS